MPWITPVQKTLLKLRPIDSKQLGANEFRDRAAGDKLGIVSIRKSENNHWQIRMSGDLTIGGTKTRECYIWPGHWGGAAAALAQSLDAARDKAVSLSVRSTLPIADGKLLDIAYKSQTDNKLNPTGACNVTSTAITLEYWGIKGGGLDQFEDELYEWLEVNGLSRHDPNHLARLINAYGCRDDFTTRATIYQIKAAIDNGNPVIIHGYFTSFGHIIVVVGYNSKGLICHDPYGEWTSEGYIRNNGSNPRRGEAIVYSYGLIDRVCLPDGGCWAHFVTRPGGATATNTPATSNQVTSPRKITQSDINRAAGEMGIEPRILSAVIKVEVGETVNGFLPSGRPKILFEAQRFGYYTDDQYNDSHPDISAIAWNKSLYKGGEAEWDRLERAAKLDEDAAYMSASWGIGQIMGMHWQTLGYKSVRDFAQKMGESEGEQLLAMARFIKSDPAMIRALKNKAWADFAYKYNGEGYKANAYDAKLAQAYAAGV